MGRSFARPRGRRQARARNRCCADGLRLALVLTASVGHDHHFQSLLERCVGIRIDFRFVGAGPLFRRACTLVARWKLGAFAVLQEDGGLSQDVNSLQQAIQISWIHFDVENEKYSQSTRE